MRKLEGRITLLVNGNGATLYIQCASSTIHIASIEINAEDFCSLLARQTRMQCLIDIPDEYYWERIGKRHVIKPFSFPLPDDVTYSNRKEKAAEILPTLVPEGWVGDNYFSSQDSFTKKGDVEYANTHIRTWI